MKGKIGTCYLLFLYLLIFLVTACDSQYPTLTANIEPAENDDVIWEGRKIKDWRRDLRYFKKVKKVSVAAGALVRAGKLAVPGLANDIQDVSTPAVNFWAAKALFHIGLEAQTAIPAIENALKNSQGYDNPLKRYYEPWGRATIIRIKNDPKKQLRKITVLLKDSSEHLRFHACSALSALAELGNLADEALPSLQSALNDKDQEVRQCAKEAIQYIEK
jgi:HEAT repeat protein